jgi:V8-like Glu-specific endopeptidase
MLSSTTAYPYNTVVYITATFSDFTLQGSGVLISPDEVLTASHVVYAQDEGTAASVTVSPGYNAGSAPYGSRSAASFHYNPIDDSGGSIYQSDSQHDYAVIHLSQPFTGLGTMGYGPGFGGGAANVTGYPGSAGGAQVTSAQSTTLDPNYTLIDGADTGSGSSGGPVWVTDGGGHAKVVGLVSAGTASAQYDNLITPGECNQIASWVAQDDTPGAAAGAPGAGLTAVNQTMQQAVIAKGAAYGGPVNGVQNQFVNVAIDDLNVALSTKNWYVKTGYGDDAVAASGGTNVLDGGAGSNFLTGAKGTDGGNDTFFLDASDPYSTTWDTIVNFHPGDALTLWGFISGTSVTSWAASDGTAGYTGVTLHASLAGAGTAVDGSVTFAGLSLATEQSKFAVTQGTSGGLPYLYVKYTA